MSYQTTFTCDVCGRVKGETNHWFVALHPVGIWFGPWSENRARQPKSVHLCGETCACIHLSEFLSELKGKQP